MQISAQQVQMVLEKVARAQADARSGQAVHSVQELAEKYGITREDLQRFADRTASVGDDPYREQRISELARRVMEGAYAVEPDAVVDMAERRAIADRSGLI